MVGAFVSNWSCFSSCSAWPSSKAKICSTFVAFSTASRTSSSTRVVVSSVNRCMCVEPASAFGIAIKKIRFTSSSSSRPCHFKSCFSVATANAASFTASVLPCGTAKPSPSAVGPCSSRANTACRYSSLLCSLPSWFSWSASARIAASRLSNVVCRFISDGFVREVNFITFVPLSHSTLLCIQQ